MRSGPSPYDISFNLDSLEAPSPNTATLEARALTYEFLGTQNIQLLRSYSHVVDEEL